MSYAKKSSLSFSLSHGLIESLATTWIDNQTAPYNHIWLIIGYHALACIDMLIHLISHISIELATTAHQMTVLYTALWMRLATGTRPTTQLQDSETTWSTKGCGTRRKMNSGSWMPAKRYDLFSPNLDKLLNSNAKWELIPCDAWLMALYSNYIIISPNQQQALKMSSMSLVHIFFLLKQWHYC